MKKTVKSLVAVATALVLGSAAFAETSLSFYDKVYSDLVTWGNAKADYSAVGLPNQEEKTDADFAGINNRVNAEFKSDRVDAGVDIIFTLDNLTKGAAVTGFTVKDYYVEFRPVEILTLGFSDDIFTTGSYLPVQDDNIATGNFGSDFVLCIRPIEGLRIAGGLDFTSYFGVENKAPVLNFGADFATDVFAIGGALRDVCDTNGFAFGVYGAFTGVDGLTVTAGYTRLGGGLVVAGDNVLSLGATLVVLDEALTLNLDCETSFGESSIALNALEATYNPYLYVGFNPEYQITDALDAGIWATAKFAKDEDQKATGTEFEINPYVDYAIGNHKFGIGFDVVLVNGKREAVTDKYVTLSSTSFAIPVYYKYAF